VLRAVIFSHLHQAPLHHPIETMSSQSRIEYSEKYADDVYEYRYVVLALRSLGYLWFCDVFSNVAMYDPATMTMPLTLLCVSF